jgi:hypothetical protein
MSREIALRRARRVREALLDHGVPEVSIELQEGRPTYGADTWTSLQPVAVFSHHIASNPTPDNPVPGLALVKAGRYPDLPGPLANGTAGVDLVYRILCLGWANHPGYGGPLTVTGPCGAYRIPADNARPYAWGSEYEGGYTEAVWDREYVNARTGRRMTFREFMGRANAGLCAAIWDINGHGRTPTAGADLSGYHGEHKTWAPDRKIDRLNYTTDTGRAELARYAGPTPEDDVPAEDVWNYRIENFPDTGGEDRRAQDWLLRTMNASSNARVAAQQANARAARIEAAVKALAAGMDQTVRAQVDAALEEALPESFGLNARAVARRLAPLLLERQTALTQDQIEAALRDVFSSLGAPAE